MEKMNVKKILRGTGVLVAITLVVAICCMGFADCKSFDMANADVLEVVTEEGNPVEQPTAVPTVKPTVKPTAVPTAVPMDNGEVDKITAYVKEELMPILTGLLTGLMTILALVVPYIKTIGKLKSTQGAYSTVYNEHEKLLGLAKEFDTDSVKQLIIAEVTEKVKEMFEKYDNSLAKVIGQEEIQSAQLNSLIEGAKLAWKEADGASVALSKAPTATVIEKQSLAIEFLKSLIAKELGLKKQELESKMAKELGL